ncbi:uncharacterized protein B0H18DRAFT_984356 [Fomitopsis serialis]|uniref:uncharacterized protein n=1 Tax=Fomitopsis serialis TaxID=139415 RepID=UPI00200743D5|nr:uncharacterized protein B0H18DRAFT_984356 [Neoantrodia serialis]KAH9932868.1 hypothetical protein B0H18DRAFT_984356 [Neoantrodia serialis]
MESIQVALSSHTCTAGGAVSGEQEQIEEVHVKFRGSVYTFISPARTDLNETREIDIVRDQVSVWSRGSAYPPPDSHNLSIPFVFNVSSNIPPSYESTALECRAVVRYGVEAVGVRPGALRLNRRVFIPVIGLPADAPGAPLRAILQSGWTGAWNAEIKHKQVRPGFWGEHADVSVEFKYPAVKTMVLFAAVPFTLTVVTTSKSCKRTPEKKPMWPAPPDKPEDVRVELRRTAYVRTSHLTWTQNDRLSLLGNLGEAGKGKDVQTVLAEKEWLPINGMDLKGKWRQRTSFSSTFSLSCPPSFHFPTLSVEVRVSSPLISHHVFTRGLSQYNITVVVPLSGLNNTVRLDIPITVSSGMVPRPTVDVPDYTAPPPGAPPDDADYLAPPPTLDLPPSYWNAAE